MYHTRFPLYLSCCWLHFILCWASFHLALGITWASFHLPLGFIWASSSSCVADVVSYFHHKPAKCSRDIISKCLQKMTTTGLRHLFISIIEMWFIFILLSILTPTASTLYTSYSSIPALPEVFQHFILIFLAGLPLTPTASTLHISHSPIPPLPEVFQHSVLTFYRESSSHTHIIHSPYLLFSYSSSPSCIPTLCPHIL